ncbi:MAG: biopolymer transporter ExbD [Spirochaetaceae bacterium]|jgi:biopolymer transport protein ExbD|nr:biopolymer transporter ExbD [Spirochaetaceae bacterium]
MIRRSPKITLRRRKRGSIENSSALSDMAFLLIIYFIVIAGFNVNRGFLMNLPRKGSVTTVKSGDLLRFSLDGRGRLFFQGNSVTAGEASGKIRALAAERPAMAVALSVNGGAPWQSVVSFIDLARGLGVENFSLTMEPETGPEPGGAGNGGSR